MIQTQEVMLVAAHDGGLTAAAEYGPWTAFVHRPLEWGAGREAKPPPAGRFGVLATDFLDLDLQLGKRRLPGRFIRSSLRLETWNLKLLSPDT